MFSVNALEFIFLNVRVVFGQLFLLVSEVVKCAFVALSMAMFLAKHVPAFAGGLHKAYFFGALPALVQVAL